jgi:hypothetical protein
MNLDNPAPTQPRAHTAACAVRDWLETQSQVTRYWREVLVSVGGSETLIAALDDHASFLNTVAHEDEGVCPPQQ